MELKPDATRILASESLRERLPDIEDGGDPFDQIAGQAVYVVIDRRIANQKKPLSGVLRSVLFGSEPELEVMVELSEALATVKAEQLEFFGIELHHGEEMTVPMPGPWTIKAARIDDIDVVRQSCILGVQLTRVKKA